MAAASQHSRTSKAAKAALSRLLAFPTFSYHSGRTCWQNSQASGLLPLCSQPRPHVQSLQRLACVWAQPFGTATKASALQEDSANAGPNATVSLNMNGRVYQKIRGLLKHPAALFQVLNEVTCTDQTEETFLRICN